MKKNKYYIYLVASSYYKDIANRQIKFASERLNKLFGSNKLILRVVDIEGSLEVPYVVNYILQKFKKVDGIVTTGCLIKGETNHFDNISKIVSEQLTILSVKFNTPITSGIVSVSNKKQILPRTNGGKKDRAVEAVDAIYKLIVSAEAI
ncbi:6,7-dimethyl-8-ribityllumazine synthase [bacterium]|nr:6,7-dimethyl-8-ribityllumazine synthase [bacterium]|tara:strand:- start:1456 stop:1902 length:447 start_codon:yes stop_codon:yes gene_type:complete